MPGPRASAGLFRAAHVSPSTCAAVFGAPLTPLSSTSPSKLARNRQPRVCSLHAAELTEMIPCPNTCTL
eukprot:1229-Heterococcus_DN1.PRE.1